MAAGALLRNDLADDRRPSDDLTTGRPDHRQPPTAGRPRRDPAAPGTAACHLSQDGVAALPRSDAEPPHCPRGCPAQA
jgi:hypothetical protein